MQYRIAICDDVNYYVNLLEGFVKEYAVETNIQAETAAFTDGQELLESFQKKIFDIVLLDVEMPDMDGIELGKEIRRINPDAVLIYITVHESYCLDAANLEAMYYIVKPIDKNRMFRVLRNATTLIRGKQAELLIQKRYIEVTANYETVALELTKIVYMQKDQNRLLIHMLNKKVYVCYDTVKHMITLLPRNLFFQVSGSMIVNLYYVKEMRAYQIRIVTNVETITFPISRISYKRLKNDYLIFQKRLSSHIL
ncbi:LytTR family DNA-binding domain-containing protein [Anaerolentibacter hominis]|uniref:LytR/AlgR family response regulator transcription factor n=1 Tax=Anaerolentibacter hominis TaxID=3079009 RepID=UPI0031B872F4